jgi:hypothetical protein
MHLSVGHMNYNVEQPIGLPNPHSKDPASGM